MKWRCRDASTIIDLLKRWYPLAPTMLAISSLEDECVPAWGEGEVLNQLYPMGDQPVVDIQSCDAELPAEQRMDLHEVMMENSSVSTAARDEHHWWSMRSTQEMPYPYTRECIRYHMPRGS